MHSFAVFLSGCVCRDLKYLYTKVEQLESGLGKLLGGTLITPAAAAALISSLHKISASGVVKPLSSGGAGGKSAGGAADNNKFVELIERTALAASGSTGGAAPANMPEAGKHASKGQQDGQGKSSSSSSNSRQGIHASSLLEALANQGKRVLERDAKSSSGGGSGSGQGTGSSAGGSYGDSAHGDNANTGSAHSASSTGRHGKVSCWQHVGKQQVPASHVQGC
jgi:hypothetical protein